MTAEQAPPAVLGIALSVNSAEVCTSEEEQKIHVQQLQLERLLLSHIRNSFIQAMTVQGLGAASAASDPTGTPNDPSQSTAAAHGPTDSKPT